MSYILITPIQNESENLPKLKDTIINQTIKPLIWVIVDSGSTDNSYQLAKELFKDYEWVHIIKQKRFFEKGYGYKNFAEAINEGYSYAKNLCIKKQIYYSFIGKTDATPILNKDYFEILLEEMKEDNRLAITCGFQKLHYKNQKIYITPLYKIPLTGFNDIRLYRKEFFEEIGGYPLAPSPDGILLIKAKNKGWKVKVVRDAYFVKPRLGGSKIGIWEGCKLMGKGMYILGYHPLLMLLNVLYNSIRFPPHYQLLPMIWGYFLGTIQHEKKIEDNEILEYFGKKRLKEVIYAFFGKDRSSYDEGVK